MLFEAYLHWRSSSLHHDARYKREARKQPGGILDCQGVFWRTYSRCLFSIIRSLISFVSFCPYIELSPQLWSDVSCSELWLSKGNILCSSAENHWVQWQPNAPSVLYFDYKESNWDMRSVWWWVDGVLLKLDSLVRVIAQAQLTGLLFEFWKYLWPGC